MLVYDHEGGDGAIVDPGVQDPTRLLEEITARDLTIRYILNTHGHFDHVVGNALLDLPQALLGLHSADRRMLLAGGGGAEFGVPNKPPREPDLELTDGMQLSVGELQIRIIHTPGHSPGSICLYVPQDEALISGDTLFAGGVGRTDFYGGDLEALKQSLRRLLELPPETRIYPGHGETTTLAEERRTNPWLQELT
jgi:glyoxylase-like metal-dependent hydrolase (beta-lactamase superfamily II)